jgi:hypothetical protein
LRDGSLVGLSIYGGDGGTGAPLLIFSVINESSALSSNSGRGSISYSGGISSSHEDKPVSFN